MTDITILLPPRRGLGRVARAESATVARARGGARSPMDRAESGSVLILFMLLMIPLLALSSAMINLGARQVTERESARGRALALLNAESGIDHGLAQLLTNGNNFEPVEVTYDGSDSLRYRVELEDLGEDGEDNDGDGSVDESDEGNLRRLVSRGSLNVVAWDGDQPVLAADKAFTKRIRAYGMTFSGLPQFPFAVYLGDPLAEIQFNGNAFVIDGNDYLMDGASLAGNDAELGIACTGDPDYIADQLSSNQTDNVDGSGGEPSIGTVATIDLQEYIDQYKNAASITFSGGEKYGGDLGTPEDMTVTYSNGNLELTGGSVGGGLLLVEGNLVIKGSFDYTGIIIVTGQVIFRGGGGEKRVIGTVLCEGDFIDGSNNNTEDLELSGTVDILYSSEAQSQVGEAFSTTTLFGWQEF